MNETDLHYPSETCPFCTIATAYPPSASPLWSSSKEALMACVPKGDVGIECLRTDPRAFVVLAAGGVLAFLDILPMVGGEFMFDVSWLERE
jgi:hypothetical protein